MSPLKVSISNYGDYSSDNYGAHSLRVNFGNLTLYFSYKTVIAFSTPGDIKVSENLWGPTTEKHLNWIDGGDKKTRLKRDDDEQIKTYVQYGGTYCPYCNSHNISANEIHLCDYEESYIEETKCLNCKQTWTDIYKIVDIREHEVGA